MPSNPILPGFNPDPSICRVGNHYYMATSTFEYFPGVPIYKSANLVEWELIGHALNRTSQLRLDSVPPGGGVYAPTLRHHKGRFYMTTSICYGRLHGMHFEPRGFYVWTDDISHESSWSDPIYFDQLGIDQDLFFDDDDKVYLCTSRSNHGKRQAQGSYLLTYGCEIDLATGDSLSPPTLLRYNTVHDIGGGVAEGPHIYKIAGWYYLLTAEGGTGSHHKAWIQRSRSPLGPYEQPPDGVNPLVFNPEGASDIGGTGHADMVVDELGRWWAVMLATHLHKATGPVMGTVGRQPFLCPVTWTAEGWPVFNQGNMIQRRITGTDLPDHTWTGDFQDSFNKPELERHWYHLRTPIKSAYSLHSPVGRLTIRGNALKIDSLSSPAMLSRKLPCPAGTWETEMDYEPANQYEEAGVTVFLSSLSHVAVSLRCDVEGRRIINIRWSKDQDESDFAEESIRLTSTQGAITFRVDMTQTAYIFQYKESQATESTFTTLKVLPSSTVIRDREGDSCFTGTMLGLFAQGLDGEACQNPASFLSTSFVSRPL